MEGILCYSNGLLLLLLLLLFSSVINVRTTILTAEFWGKKHLWLGENAERLFVRLF